LSIVELKAVTVDLPIYNVSTRSLRKAVMKLSTGGKIMQDGHQRVSIRALDRVSLKLEAGDRLGLLGHNGSGKTTLLRTIAGVYPPSRGQVEVKGDISSMFDLTMGMDMEASGEENIVLMAIRAAAGRLAGQIERTPCRYSRTLSKITGAEVWVKFENLQFTAAYKERGALNKLMLLSDAEKAKGVIAASAGNHAQGLAYHGARLGVPVTIVMPKTTPFVKVQHTRDFGATGGHRGREL
jgi:energy-coupling factor transporter ATP-binding protein EcfA2